MLDGVRLTQKHSGSIYEIPYQNKPTFNLPSFFAGDSIIYGTPGLRDNGGVPNITGDFGFMGAGNSRGWFTDISGVFYFGAQKPASRRIIGEGVATTDTTLLRFDASRISSVYNDSQKVYASGVKLRFCIKY